MSNLYLPGISRLIDQLTVTFESRAPWDEEGKYTLDKIGVSFLDRFSESKLNLSLDLL
jgi:hypothetical protein